MYTDKKPKVILYEIKSKIPLLHQDILGTLFSLNINNEMFGDIIVDNNKYYFYILAIIDNYIKSNFLFIRNTPIELIEKDLDYLANYYQKYEEKELIISSLRIDTIIAHIINTNRNNVLEKIKNKEVILNYDILDKNSRLLKEGDIFSIRKYGKYKFIGVVNKTKKGSYVIKYLKYI